MQIPAMILAPILLSVTTWADPAQLPPLTSAQLTTETTRRLIPVPNLLRLNPSDPAELRRLLSAGFGKLVPTQGEALLDRTLDGSTPPAIGAHPTRITRFLHLADVQLADDESPARVAKLDSKLLSAAFRPAEAHGCHLLNSAVRTANALHAQDPLDFVMLGGDNIDNAQSNELDWFRAILAGDSVVECDSGQDNEARFDPLFPKVPFTPVGLDVPWYWVSGNHDVLAQGNVPIASVRSRATSGFAALGARVWEKPGGPVKIGYVPADERRAFVSEKDLLERLMGDGDGHGVTSDAVAQGRANYIVDRGVIRYVIFDTTSALGGAEGVTRSRDMVTFLMPAIQEAKDKGMLVVVVTHHGSGSIIDRVTQSTSNDALRQIPMDAMPMGFWRDILGGYDNVIMHLAAHTHVNRITQVKPAGDHSHSYWEVQTSSLADFPNQMRLIEIHDQDNGYLTISGTSVDVAMSSDDPYGQTALTLAALDVQSGWLRNGSGEASDRNVRLWLKKP